MTKNRNKIFIPYIISSAPNPFKIVYSGDWVVANHLWSTLIDHKSDGTFEGVLAKSWSRSSDGLEWRFQLRNNLRWSDESPMLLPEVVQSLNISLKGTTHTDFSKSIRSITSDAKNTIIFKLKTPINLFLYSLTYVDWSIIDPKTYSDNNLKLTPVTRFSGPFSLGAQSPGMDITNNVQLKYNQFSPIKIHPLVKEGEIQSFKQCSQIKEQIDNVATFRLYRDDVSDECMDTFKKAGFEIFSDQPSWIIKADFTRLGRERVTLDKRLQLIYQLQDKLKSDFSKVGNMRATGLRAPHLFGSLSENEFDDFLTSLELKPVKHPKEAKLTLHVVTMEQWSRWKSYEWLIESLSSQEIRVKVTNLTRKEFFSEFLTGEIHTKYDLIFFPLGVGDNDPDGTWRIANKYIYPNFIEEQELEKAFLASNLKQRAGYYKSFAKKLLAEGMYIPLVMNSDIIGIHKSFTIKEGKATRNGLSLYDLE